MTKINNSGKESDDTESADTLNNTELSINAEETVFSQRQWEVIQQYEDGNSAPDIAEELDISASAVRQAISGAREKIRKVERSLELLQSTELRPILPIDWTPDRAVDDSDWADGDWSEWTPLEKLHSSEEDVGGVIRLRHWARPGIVYLGYTSRVGGRITAIINQLNREERPDTAPVSAAPQLWDLVKAEGPGIEGSVLLLPESSQTQLAAVGTALLAHARQNMGHSPISAFGGGKPNDSHPPLDWSNLDGPSSDEWLGLNWSRWRPLSSRLDDPRPEGSVVYQIRTPQGVITKVGSTKAPTDRFRAHENNYRGGEESEEYQFRFVELDTEDRRQLREVEAEVHGAAILQRGVPLDFQRL